MSNLALITGATGTQGGAVARALLRRGRPVRAFVREPERAVELARLGAELVAGDHDDLESITRALAGVSSVFLVATPDEALTAEIPRARRWLDTLAHHRVEHLVYSSIANADRHTAIPHFEVKATIEAAIRRGTVPWTIVGPAYLMENNTTEFALAGLRRGRIERFVDIDREVAQVAADDVGECVAGILERGAAMFGRRIDLASDEVSARSIAEISSPLVGAELEPVRVAFPPSDAAPPLVRSIARMLRWLDDEGFTVDRAALRREFPEVRWHDFSSWAAKQSWPRVFPRRDAG